MQRWHVRTKENIARVRKDEAEAAEKEKEEERRIKLAEQEARTAFLRNRAREFKAPDTSEESKVNETKEKPPEADIYTADGNINFFKEIESGIKKTGTNKDYEKEKKEEQDEYEKKIGLLTYLGQDSHEASGTAAWYQGKKLLSVSDSSEEVGLKSKHKLDPINEIIKHTGLKARLPKAEKPRQIQFISSSTPSTQFVRPSSDESPLKKSKKHKKKKKRESAPSSHRKKKCKRRRSDSPSPEKRRKKSRRHSSSSSESDGDDSDEEKKSTLAKLREERLKREATERKREERLLAGKNPDEEEKKETKELPYKQKYNSQFNPHIAKQNVASQGLQAGVKYWLQ